MVNVRGWLFLISPARHIGYTGGYPTGAEARIAAEQWTGTQL